MVDEKTANFDFLLFAHTTLSIENGIERDNVSGSRGFISDRRGVGQ